VVFTLHLPATSSGNFSSKLKRVDFGGAITLVLFVFTLLYGMDRAGNVAWDDRMTITSLSASFTFFLAFASIEMKFAKEPFAPKRIIANRTLCASYFVNFFGLASGFCLIFYIPLFFQAVQEKSASETGLWLLFSVVGTMFGTLLGGLTIQATGKYYALTVLGYTSLLLGTVIISLMSGSLMTSNVGIIFGTSSFLVPWDVLTSSWRHIIVKHWKLYVTTKFPQF